MTRLLASNGSTVGTYSVGTNPQGIAFDGINIWVANNGDNTVTELLAVNGTTVSTYGVGTSPQGIAFDGASIWVTNTGSHNVTKIIPGAQ